MALRQTEMKQVTINGVDFYIKPFPAMKSANLSGELASLLTPLLAALVPLVGKGMGREDKNEGGLMELEVEEAVPEIAKAFEFFSGDKVELLLRKLLLVNKNIVAEIENDQTGEQEQLILNEDLLNELFCSEVQDMYILAFEVIRLNYNGFFKRLGALSGKAGAAVAKIMKKS